MEQQQSVLEEFPFVDSSNSFEESSQSVSSFDPVSNFSKKDEVPITFISDHSPDSPSSPSSSGLRHRQLASSSRSSKQIHQSQFFRNNPDGLIDLIDFDPHPRSSNSKNGGGGDGGDGDGGRLYDETDEISTITSVSGSEGFNEESVTVNSPNSANSANSANSDPDLVNMLIELVIEVITFQTKLLAKSVKFSLQLIRSFHMLLNSPNSLNSLNDPYEIIRFMISYMQGNIVAIWGICYSSFVKLIDNIWFQNQNRESVSKLCVRIGWGMLWLGYFGFVLVCLSVPAFVFSGVVMKWIVEEPVEITGQLVFDYTKDSPVAFVSVISCPESCSLVQNRKDEIGSLGEARVVPLDHELIATVSLVLPESDYNRNLGIFQVRVDFLSSDGKLLATTRKPCMLQYKSDPIRLMSAFVNLASVLTGYSSETQTLDIKFNGYTETDIPLSCSRVVIEQRAEFPKGAGVPEIYSASLKLESQLPFLKRMLWYWKGLIYMWISLTMFITELLIMLLCCTRVMFPWVRRVGGSSVNNATPDTSSG
ncbi:hypothetical protein SSX86_015683 [Deinandra increscens subsp. villosa]|uniref:Seipin n=1 Tax=Deinandra increscens subsp. villosa TaxID=3103831 RepID=A0AAP0GUX6_9ASTR